MTLFTLAHTATTPVLYGVESQLRTTTGWSTISTLWDKSIPTDMGRNMQRLKNAFIRSNPLLLGSALGIGAALLLQWMGLI